MSPKKDNQMENLSQELSAKGLLDDNLKDYIIQASQYGVLPNDEQLELLKKYRETNDEKIFQKLVNHNLRLGVFVAKRYEGRCTSMSFMDLVQEANIAMIRAFQLFRVEDGTTLSTYIVKCMIRSIQRQIDKEDSAIRKPIYISLLERKYNNYICKFFLKNKRMPTEEELMKDLNINEESLKTLTKLELLDPISLNKEKSLEADNSSELQDFIPYEEKYELVESNLDTKILIAAAKEMLTNKEYYIIYYRVIVADKKRLEQIAKEFGVTRERIRQIEKKSLEKLKRIKQHRDKLLKYNTVMDIDKQRITPMTAKEISYYHYLKEHLDEVIYYFIYTKREKNYSFNNYKKELTNLTETEIKKYMNICLELEQELFTPEKQEKVFEETSKQKIVSDIFNFKIAPVRINNKKSQSTKKRKIKSKN